MKKLITILTIIIASCVYVEEVKVIKTNPENKSEQYNISTVSISFSAEMNKHITEKAISITSESEIPDYYFSWRGSILKIIFRKNLPSGKFILRIDSSAESSSGRNIENAYSSYFFVGNANLLYPEIISCTPSNKTISDSENRTISIKFNTPVKPESAENAFSITPPLKGYFTMEENNTVLSYVAEKNLPFKSSYSITIDTSLEGENGLKLKKNFTSSFKTPYDNTSPYIVKAIALSGNQLLEENIINQNLETEENIVLFFSEQMDETSLSSIELSGGIEQSRNYDETEKTLTLKIKTIPSQEAVLTIPSQIRDIFQNTSIKPYYFQLEFNSINTSYFTIDKIFQKAPSENNYTELYQNSCINIVDSSYFYIEDSYEREQLVLTVTFLRDNKSVNLNLISLIEFSSIKIVCYNGSELDTLKTPRITAVKKNTLKENSYDFYFINFEPEVYYKFIIKGGENGIFEESGNTLKNDFIFYLNT